MESLILASVLGFDINELWWNIAKGLYTIVDGIQRAFFILAGIEPISNNALTEAGNTDLNDNFLITIFTKSKADSLYKYFLYAAALIMAATIIIAIIKIFLGHKNDDYGKSLGKLSSKTFSSILLMFLIPLLYTIGIRLVGAFFDGIVNSFNKVLNTGSTSSFSLAKLIHNVCLPQGVNVPTWDISYDNLKEAGAADDYQYLFGILSSGIIIYILVISCITLVDRFIAIIKNYIISPMVLARVPLDDGRSFDNWVNKVLAKFLGAAGIIISMLLFFTIIPEVDALIDNAIAVETDFVKINSLKFMKMLFVIGGAVAASKGATEIADLISTSAGQSEAASQAQSARLLSGGMKLAGTVAGKGVAGAMMAKGGASAAGGVAGGLAAGLASGGGSLSSTMANTSGAFTKQPQPRGGNLTEKYRRANAEAKSAGRSGLGSAIGAGGVIGGLAYGASRLAAPFTRPIKGAMKATTAPLRMGANAAKQGADNLKSKMANKWNNATLKAGAGKGMTRGDYKSLKEQSKSLKQDKSTLKQNMGLKNNNFEHLQKTGGRSKELSNRFENELKGINDYKKKIDEGQGAFKNLNNSQKSELFNNFKNAKVQKIEDEVNNLKRLGFKPSNSLNDKIKKAKE